MATPTRSQVASTPKSYLNTTPSRPNTSFANKHLAGKSPAVKTPASIHGHAHRISTSSYPTSTPLAASMLPDDLLNLNTPSAAALMATMSTTGLTPLPTIQDGLGITTSVQGGSTHDGSGPRNPQSERLARLKEIAQTLKQKSAGRGVTMESIKQVAQINGFDADWDSDVNVLTLAGKKYVEVEIAFKENDINVVDKTTFKLNLPDDDEAILQEEDSQVLQNNLTDVERQNLQWHDLSGFSANLEYLGQLEHVETPGNCFKVMDNLYDTFQKIWIEEKKRMKWRHDVHHLCQSNVGEPRRNSNGRLGVSSRYWANGQTFFAKQDSKVEEEEEALPTTGWTAKFLIEAGHPSILASQKWIADEPLVSAVTAEDIFHDSTTDKPVWLDPASSQNKVSGDESSLKSEQSASFPSETLNICFLCHLEPEVLVPLQVAQSFNQTSRMFDMHQSNLQTYYHLMDNKVDRTAQSLNRWSKSHQSFDKLGKPKETTRSYILYAGNGGWAYPISQFSFCHPQKYAEIIPVLRQYALVNTLLRSISAPSSSSNANDIPIKSTTAEQKTLVDRPKVVKRTNKPKLEAKLNSVLRPNAATVSSNENLLAVDIRLDHNSSENKSCRIDLRIPLSLNILPRATLTRLGGKPFLLITIDVLRNGIVEILNIEGINLKDRLEEMKKRTARAVRASEDLSVVIEWLLRELSVM